MKIPKIEIGTYNEESQCIDGTDASVSMGAKVKIDGKEIPLVQKIDIHLGAGEFATVNIELVGEVDIDELRAIANVTVYEPPKKSNKVEDLVSCFNAAGGNVEEAPDYPSHKDCEDEHTNLANFGLNLLKSKGTADHRTTHVCSKGHTTSQGTAKCIDNINISTPTISRDILKNVAENIAKSNRCKRTW